MAEPDSDKMELQNAAPPSYEAANQDAPPSYNQIFGVGKLKDEVMEAKESSSNKGHFALKLCNIVCGSVACMIGLIILAALPVAMIVIGAVYLDDCQGEHRIPIWLIVFGCFSLAQTAINVLKRCCKLVRKKDSDEEEGGGAADTAGRGGSCLESIISVFLFVWIIVGSAWVFGFYNQFRQCRGIPEFEEECCHAVPFLFSFISLIVMYAFSFLMLCCCCCCFVCLACVVGASGSAE